MSNKLTCDHCGSRYATAIDRPDCWRIECPSCGSVEFVWKDNEYEDDGPWEREDELSVPRDPTEHGGVI
jgi:predicted  nucleic acid-binding Zn-ribbon protein